MENPYSQKYSVLHPLDLLSMQYIPGVENTVFLLAWTAASLWTFKWVAVIHIT